MRQSGQVVGDADAVMKDVLRDLRDVTPAPTGQDCNEADKVCRICYLSVREAIKIEKIKNK